MLAEVLTRNTTLCSLKYAYALCNQYQQLGFAHSLADNAITDVGFGTLIQALAHNTAVQTLM
jgi:hypothetical protein